VTDGVEGKADDVAATVDVVEADAAALELPGSVRVVDTGAAEIVSVEALLVGVVSVELAVRA
jgi:hypothetical protein